MQTETALVTGASSGIGAVYADRLARRGHDLVIVARDQERLEALADRLATETGATVRVLAADLGRAEELARVERAIREDESITMLVNNAGIAGGGPLASGDPDLYDAIIRLNISAVTRLAAAIAPRLARLGRGTIINLSSVTALMPERLTPVYPASKAYVLALSQSLAAELGPRGVSVQAVLPGITRTEIFARSGSDINSFPAEMIMEAGEMVDAALAGLDMGETVSIPSLPNAAAWDSLAEARLRLGPDLSRAHPAARYLAEKVTN